MHLMNATEKVRILFLAANPESTSRLDLEEEFRSVESELRGVEFRDELVVTIAQAVRPDDLVRLLRKEKPSVVHFSGHGSPDGIILRGEKGHVAVNAEALVRLFRQ
jgi:CHAT domain-containing protein